MILNEDLTYLIDICENVALLIPNICNRITMLKYNEA